MSSRRKQTFSCVLFCPHLYALRRQLSSKRRIQKKMPYLYLSGCIHPSTTALQHCPNGRTVLLAWNAGHFNQHRRTVHRWRRPQKAVNGHSACISDTENLGPTRCCTRLLSLYCTHTVRRMHMPVQRTACCFYYRPRPTVGHSPHTYSAPRPRSSPGNFYPHPGHSPWLLKRKFEYWQ